MELVDWVRNKGGIAHRADAAAAGFSAMRVRVAIREGRVRRIRASWIALGSAPLALVSAADASAKLTCISAARHRGWWIPEDVDDQILHLHASSHGRSLPQGTVAHWARPLVDTGARVLLSSIEDTLAHIAKCLTHEQSLVLWESACKKERLSTDALRLVHWGSSDARACANEVQGLSDSGLETTFVVRLSPWGIRMRQQVRLCGHPVDVLIGSHLVVQLDGFEFHSSAADRTRDAAHDAQLRLRGYTVLRFTYAQIVHHWDEVERTVAAALARGLHLSPRVRGARSA